MADSDKSPLTAEEKRIQLKKILAQRGKASDALASSSGAKKPIPAAFHDFDKDPAVLGLAAQHKDLVDRDLSNPFFMPNDGIALGTTRIGGQEYINYANYNYLGLSGQSQVSEAAIAAVTRYGTSVSASRISSGERPIQRDLETALAGVYGVEDCVVFVSGHATNVTVIGHLFGPKDLILHDELAHNSAIQGAVLSGARRIPFPHNDYKSLEKLLVENRSDYERVLIFLEGVYSMDGDIPDLPKFVDLRNKFKTYLMVDEAHSFGVLGDTGRGIGELFDVKPDDVDIWMGTLSKTLASCGGYVAGKASLIEFLKYTAPGFLFSVGITPANAAASLAALELMQEEPNRVHDLQARAGQFLDLAVKNGLDIGLSADTATIPIVLGDSMLCIALSNALFAKGINVQPVLYPAVEENAARLRFFISCAHTERQITHTINVITTELARLKGTS